jgi:hypothetical protein
VSNRDWFVIAVPTAEAIEIAQGYDGDADVFLREMADAAASHYERFGPANATEELIAAGLREP